MSGSNSAERKRHEPLVLVETADLSEEEWLDYRRRGIGGSDVSAIFGTSPFRTARDLYYDKLNIASVEDDEGNWVAMEMGHLLEPLVAKIFERKTGYRVYQIKKMFQHPQYPWMLADVDYFVELPDGTTAILEIKTTNYNARDNWWMNGKETVPVYYESQGRHYMAVTDLDRCFFCCLYGNNEEEVIIREVKRDFEYEAEMVFLEQYFWENHVQRHVPPPYTESGALIIESARKHFGPADKNAPAVALDLDMTAKLMQYLRLLDEKKNAEVYSKEIDKDIQRLKALLIAEMGTSCTAVCEQEGVNYTVTYRGSFGHICGLTRRIAMGLLQHYTQLQAFIPDFTTESDAVFALNNMMALLEMTDWKQVRKDILTTDADWLDLKEKLAFSDDFVEQNRETVTEFLLQGGAAMVCALYGELDGQELAVEALRRIVQAELMGQFYKLKYFAGDLQREIRYPVSEMQESFWKKNLSLARGAFWAEEVDDFYHTLRLGELPHSTCLSYRTGSQRECLLAAFDSNKKIVLVKKDEAVVARACLRLTKGAFQKPPAVDFSFADLSQENMDSGKPVTSEKPVLFLESIYTFGLNDIEKEEVMKLAVSLTTQKAAELGVVAVLARRYLGCYERDEYVLAPFYVYISKSKNGWQYLDSLGGAAYTSAKEEYVEHPFLVIQTAMHHAGAHNRNEVDYE